MAKNSYLGELIAEFLGTMILILFGVGVVAQVVTTPDGSLATTTRSRGPGASA
jgi:glycerol uptake facilitator protein